jgi:thiamine kinase-like enzyme
LWHSSSASLGEEFFVKFAWSEPAARRVLRQIRVLEALTGEPAVPYLPQVVASGTDPLIMVTRRVRGASLFKVADTINLDHAGLQIARFLAVLHGEEARRRVEAMTGAVPAWYPLVTTSALRERFGRWVTPGEQRDVVRWCDWAAEILAEPGRQVLVHGDLHGDNQVWRGGELVVVLDFENAGAGEPEYDLRAFPGPGTGPGLELLTAVTGHYERITGRGLSVERIMAWHLHQALGDVLWRSEAGLPLPDHRAPGEWVADMAARLRFLGGQFAELWLSGHRPPEQRLGLRPVLVDRWPDYHVNSPRRAHHASAASIALSASDTPTVPCTPIRSSMNPADATQCRGIRVICPGSNRRSSGVTGSGAERS